MDLFSNPMVESAKRALTEEQQEEYKRFGEYMYTNQNYNTVETGSKVKEASPMELAFYACEALKAGGDPRDLSPAEVSALVQVHGENWYERFGFSKEEVTQVESITAAAEQRAKELPLNRKQRRALQRKIDKQKKRTSAPQK